MFKSKTSDTFRIATNNDDASVFQIVKDKAYTVYQFLNHCKYFPRHMYINRKSKVTLINCNCYRWAVWNSPELNQYIFYKCFLASIRFFFLANTLLSMKSISWHSKMLISTENVYLLFVICFFFWWYKVTGWASRVLGGCP